MKFPKYSFVLILLAVPAFAGEGARATPATLLPRQFSGWQLGGQVRASKDPAVGDPASPGVLKEYGFANLEAAAYVSDDGRKLTVKAARFQDASGAYGAFTFYKTPQMQIEKIGDSGASLSERVLFYRGDILVDAVFSRLTAMSAADLRELAQVLPPPADNEGKLPGLPAYLPKQSYVKNSAKYIVGPLALEKIDSPLPAALVDFNAGAEVVLGNYDSSGGEATLLLISYPTPQIAVDHLRRIDAAKSPSGQNTNENGGSNGASGGVPSEAGVLSGAGPIYDKRTGPIVVVAAGPLSSSEAKSLLASVNYDADVTWNQNTFFSKKDNLANLLVNVILLCGVILGLMLVAGLAFGGFRVLIKRLFPDRVFDRPEEMEIISLHLDEPGPKPLAPR